MALARFGARLATAILALVTVSAVPRAACAQTCAANASGLTRLCRNDFSVDVYQGPVLAPLRATGLAGAYAALADGVDALGSNIAASTVRPPQSASHFDYDFTVGVSLRTTS